MKKMMDFFGLDLCFDQFDIDDYADILGVRKELNKLPKIKELTKAFNARHPLVVIAKRQALLRHMMPLLNEKLLPYDQYWYTKENNISCDHDRLYGAQEKLLQIGLIVATGKNLRRLMLSEFKPDAITMRGCMNNSSKGRFDAYWEVLNNETRDYILRYKRGELNGAGVASEIIREDDSPPVLPNCPRQKAPRRNTSTPSLWDKLQFWKST